MSSEESTLGNLNFTGGVPTSSDLAPSIVFLIAFIATTPLLFWRVFKKESRCMDLLRPGLFWGARIGAYGLRAYMAKNNFTSNDLIAELVLLSLGTLFLIEPLVGIWKRHCQSSVALEEQGGLMFRAATLLRLAVLAAIILSIVASSEISSAMDDPSKISTIRTYREIAAIIQVVIVPVVLVLTLLAHMQFSLDVRRTFYIFIPGLSTFVVVVYRLIQTYSTDMNSAVHKPVVFWICSCTFEFIAYVSLIAIKIPVWYPGAPVVDGKDIAMDTQQMPVRMEGGFMGQRQYPQQPAQPQYAPPQQPYPAYQGKPYQ